jgi:hypothetical protein
VKVARSSVKSKAEEGPRTVSGYVGDLYDGRGNDKWSGRVKNDEKMIKCEFRRAPQSLSPVVYFLHSLQLR